MDPRAVESIVLSLTNSTAGSTAKTDIQHTPPMLVSHEKQSGRSVITIVQPLMWNRTTEVDDDVVSPDERAVLRSSAATLCSKRAAGRCNEAGDSMCIEKTGLCNLQSNWPEIMSIRPVLALLWHMFMRHVYTSVCTHVSMHVGFAGTGCRAGSDRLRCHAADPLGVSRAAYVHVSGVRISRLAWDHLNAFQTDSQRDQQDAARRAAVRGFSCRPAG